MTRELPAVLPPATLDVMARAASVELGAKCGTLLALRVSVVEKHGLLTDQLERAYRRGVRDGWRVAYNHMNPKGTAPNGPTS